MKKLLLTGCLCTGMIVNLLAQEKQEQAYPVLLTNFTLHYNGNENIKDAPRPGSAEIVNGHVYRIIQLKGIHLGPSDLGFEALQYLPKHAFIVRIPVKNYDAVKQSVYARGGWMSLISPEMKLSKRLYQDNIPEWAWTGNGNFKAWITYFKDLGHEDVRQRLTRYGYTILEEQASDHRFMVSIPAEAVDPTAALPFVSHLQEMEDPGHPENYTARTNHRVNTLQSSYPGAPDYDGSGVVVGIGDDGEIGPHIDYKGRLTQNAGNSSGDHGDHVAGTVFGAGNLNPRGRGMAPGAEVYYQNYPTNLQTVDNNYDNLGVRITNSSYSNGCNDGYTNFTQQMDQDILDNPTLLHVFSAGNDGSSNCNYGAGPGWGNVTGGHKIAKNVLTVANLSREDVLSGSSSRGPASDGRIKPDIAAVGSSVFSTSDPNTYVVKSGTSMSSPGTAGTAAVLYQAMRDKNSGNDPESGLLKAIMQNSADDLGQPGPDFLYGYGRLNARRAYKIINNQNYFIDSVTDGNSKSFQIVAPANTAQVKIMLYWPDLPASTSAARAIVNDLDLEVLHGGTTLLPWVLDPTPNPANLNSPAVQARDSLNNMEQVTITNPSGNIDINVTGFNVPGMGQKFYVVYEFIEDEVILTYPLGGEGFVPGETEYIRWDAPSDAGNFSLEYSADGGLNWQVINNSIGAGRRYETWVVPDSAGSTYKIRVSRNGKSSETPGTFTIIDVPKNINVPRSCPDSLLISWDPVPGAIGYIVYRLGARYMDSVGTTTFTSMNVAPSNPFQEDWLSVAAIAPGNNVGQRAIAIQKPQGIFNCGVVEDLKLTKVVSPPTGAFPDCYNLINVPVTVRVQNSGRNPVSNFQLAYSFDNGPATFATVNSTIAPGGFLDYTFPGSSLTLLSNHTIQVVCIYANDENAYNDTLSGNIQTYTGSTVTIPYTQNFESFSSCGTNSNCEQTFCTLTSGWYNPANGFSDDIDWRTNNGPTPSNQTGPSVDHNPGTGTGNYLYLEASGGCDSSVAYLMSPCIDLTSASSPVLSFWYHMFGANMGTLGVDIFDGSEWHYDVIPVISGNQGTSWKEQQVNLLPYIGNTIVIRFRGKTGNDFAADVSIDDIGIFENSQSPLANFNQDNAQTCMDGVVNFTDISQNSPTSWSWDIQPNTFAFVNGSSSSSRNISVQFQDAGTYQVELRVSNAFGNDTLVRSSAVVADPGVALPVFEDFETPLSLPQNWELENPDGFISWTLKNVTGATGAMTKAAVIENSPNANFAQEDGLVSENIDMRSVANPILFFDVAHAPRPGREDSLIVDISTDCGLTYQATAYQKGSSQLQTVPPTSALFSPSVASDWRRDTVDLSPYIGSNVKLRFRNYSDLGNAVYLDNIQLVSSSAVAPISAFSASDTLACLNDDVVFTDLSSGGAATTYNWDFGSGAVPNAANTAGPHNVKFVRTGIQTVTLTVSNNGGFSQHTITIDVKRKPLSVFNTSILNPLTVQFNDLSLYDPDEWYWDFGDGDTSSMQNPVHTYDSAGTYNVYQKVTNRCGFTDRTVTVALISTPEEEELYSISLYPNPNTGKFNLEMEGISGQTVQVQIMDLSGKVILNDEREVPGGSGTLEFNLDHAAPGVYLLRVQTEKGTHTLRTVKR
ncbi:MAG: hypothetical protein CMI35_10660 [Owenweeksia sp.]|nr:hypothetical protein [Owenweeksia sp.]